MLRGRVGRPRGDRCTLRDGRRGRGYGPQHDGRIHGTRWRAPREAEADSHVRVVKRSRRWLNHAGPQYEHRGSAERIGQRVCVLAFAIFFVASERAMASGANAHSLHSVKFSCQDDGLHSASQLHKPALGAGDSTLTLFTLATRRTASMSGWGLTSLSDACACMVPSTASRSPAARFESCARNSVVTG